MILYYYNSDLDKRIKFLQSITAFQTMLEGDEDKDRQRFIWMYDHIDVQ